MSSSGVAGPGPAGTSKLTYSNITFIPLGSTNWISLPGLDTSIHKSIKGPVVATLSLNSSGCMSGSSMRVKVGALVLQPTDGTSKGVQWIDPGSGGGVFSFTFAKVFDPGTYSVTPQVKGSCAVGTRSLHLLYS